MADAVLTPRVRIMAVCDGLRESRTETDVFDLKKVRQAIHAQRFPFQPSRLWLYLLLSSPRPGEHPCYVVVNDRNDKRIFYGRLVPHPTFAENVEFRAYGIRLRCSFPDPGRYVLQVWFFQEQGTDVLKGEFPLDVLQESALPHGQQIAEALQERSFVGTEAGTDHGPGGTGRSRPAHAAGQ
jgi:hypothetical protein